MELDEEDQLGSEKPKSSGSVVGTVLLILGFVLLFCSIGWFVYDSRPRAESEEEPGVELVGENGETAPVAEVESSVPDDRPRVIIEEPAKKPVAKDKELSATVDSLQTELKIKPRIVRFVIMRDHSASQTSRDQKLSASLIDSIMSGVYDPNRITVYQFGTSVRPIGTAAGALERKQLMGDWKAFIPSSGWRFSASTNRIDDTRPLDDQFTNLTGLFDSTLPSIYDFAADGEYVCVIVLTDGINQPPFRRGHPGQLLENESAKRNRINAQLEQLRRDAPNNVEINIIEIGHIKKPGSVVDDILGGFGTTHQADSWSTVAPVVAAIQRHCQGIYWWDNVPKNGIEFPLSEDKPDKPIGKFTFRVSGPGYFRFTAASLDPLVVADLSGTVLVDGKTLADFSQPVLLTDQSQVEITVFINPDAAAALPSNIFTALRLEYVVKATPVGNLIPFLPRQKGAGEIIVYPVYPSGFTRHIYLIFAGVVILCLFAFRRLLQVRREAQQLQAEEADAEPEVRDYALKGRVLYQGEEVILFGQRMKVGHLTFTATPDGVSVFAGNDMEVQVDPDGEDPTLMRAGTSMVNRSIQKLFRDKISREIYEVNVGLSHHHETEEVAV